MDDARAGADLPRWDLSDLYQSRQAPEVAADLERARADAAVFRKDYEGKLASLSGAELARAIRRFEEMSERLGRLGSFAQLLHAGDLSDAEIGRFHQTIQEASTDISSETLFFTLELNRLDESALAEKMKDPALAHYQPWLRDLRAFRPYQLSDDLEKLLHEKQVAGRSAWVRLFDETFAALRFPLGNENLTAAEIMNRFTDKDPLVREAAAHCFAGVLKANERLFAQITNTLAKDKAIEDQWRGFQRPVSSRNLSNFLEDSVVDALSSAVAAHYPKLSHRYYALKAKWLGREKLPYWERNAPLPDDDHTDISWPKAKELVLNAYRAFSPQLAEIGQRFFDQPWIDVGPRPGKDSGAFAHPTVPSAHPYLLLNYQGRTRDVMTLAHELGHGCHQVLAAGQGALMADTPLTLAETASVFGEMLTFRALLSNAKDKRQRKILLSGKVEDMLNTVVRQIAFHRFETRLHDARKKGELTAPEIGAIWMETQKEALGPAFELEGEYASFWSYIPHFLHVPFYVYAYAFGDCLVNSLYAVYLEKPEGFAEKYLELLKAGGSKRHKELLAPFGLDASDPAFWGKGLSVIEGMIEELEGLG